MADTPNVALVKRNLDCWQNVEQYAEKLDEFVSPDLEWHNTGLPTAYGIKAARSNLRGFGKMFGTLRVEYLNVMEHGNKVVTERIDYILDKDGNTVITCPCMGIFEIENGKIKLWRDYFDATPFLARVAAASAT